MLAFKVSIFRIIFRINLTIILILNSDSETLLMVNHHFLSRKMSNAVDEKLRGGNKSAEIRHFSIEKNSAWLSEVLYCQILCQNSKSNFYLNNLQCNLQQNQISWCSVEILFRWSMNFGKGNVILIYIYPTERSVVYLPTYQYYIKKIFF